MNRFMRKYGGFLRMFAVLGLVILVLAAFVMYCLWELGDWPVVKSFPSPSRDYCVELVDWDTAGFFQTGSGSLMHFRHDGGSFGGPYNWEDIDVQWAPDGANFFLTIETVAGETEYRIVEQKSGQDPDGVGSWSSTTMIPKYREPDLQAVLTELCKVHPEISGRWTKIGFRFVQWGEDSETLCFRFAADDGSVGFFEYCYPTGEITKVYR